MTIALAGCVYVNSEFKGVSKDTPLPANTPNETAECFDASSYTLTVDALPANVSQAIRFVTNVANDAGCPQSAQKQLAICVDEIFSNIARYAYSKENGQISIDVAILECPCRICIVFKDNGLAFDPLTVTNPDISLAAEDRTLGGLGIYLVKELADEVSYTNDGDYNVLTVIKRL